MSDITTYKSVSNIYFTNASYNTSSADEVLYTGVLTIKVSSTDANVSVITSEVVVPTDFDNVVAGFVTITTHITAADNNIVADVSPVVSDHSVNISTTGSEVLDNETGAMTTTLVSVITRPIDLLDIFVESLVTNTSSEIIKEPDYRYLIVRHNLIDGFLHGNPGGDYNMTCQEMYSLMNMTCVKLSEGLYQTLKQSWLQEEVIEIDADTAYYGTTFFSEIRNVAKLWEAKTTWYGEKVPTEITPLIIGYILTVMKIFATEIVENEFERRFLTMRGASLIETESWYLQLAEAKEWLSQQGQNGSITPFLDYLALTRGINKTVLSNKILKNAETYQDKLSTLLVEMQIILDKFKKCDSVWDINILYEDYFGIAMPISMAIALERMVSADDWNRKPEWRVKGNGYYF